MVVLLHQLVSHFDQAVSVVVEALGLPEDAREAQRHDREFIVEQCLVEGIEPES